MDMKRKTALFFSQVSNPKSLMSPANGTGVSEGGGFRYRTEPTCSVRVGATPSKMATSK
jgi:hypothetical protein